jgi:type IX secretion system PorP/SprF family membrane protein
MFYNLKSDISFLTSSILFIFPPPWCCCGVEVKTINTSMKSNFFLKYRRNTSAVSLLLLPCLVLAQQLPYQTQFRQFYSYINPAAVSSDFFLYEYNTSINTSYRMQWVGQPQTPRTYQLSGDFVTTGGRRNFNLATGGMLLRDRVGPLGLTSFSARVASLFSADPYLGAFSIGFNFGMTQYRIDAGRIVWQNYNDPTIPLVDAATTQPEIGVGVYYFKRFKRGPLADDNFYAGFSIPQFWGANVDVKGGTKPGKTTPNLVHLRRVKHFYMTTGWYHFFNSDSFLELALWGKYVPGVRPNIHLTARFQPTRTVWFGGGFNPNGLTHLEAGFNIPGFLSEDGALKIGYAFDYNISAFDLPFGSSHELHVSYLFDSRR